jgi:hypothetical protein
MLVCLGDLRRYLLQEINSSLAARSVAGITPVTGPSYEGERYLAALDTEALSRGEIKVVGTVGYHQTIPVPLETGESVRPFVVATMFSTSPPIAIALMQLLFNMCKVVMSSKSVSPAAKKFIESYYSRVKDDPLLVTPVDIEAATKDPYLKSVLALHNPSQACVYHDPNQVNAQAELKRGGQALKRAATIRNVTVNSLKDEIHEEQRSAFRSAYRSLKSDRPEVKKALSGGEPTVEKLNAALRTDNYEALSKFMQSIPEPIPTDIKDWIIEHDHVFDIVDDLPPATFTRFKSLAQT